MLRWVAWWVVVSLAVPALGADLASSHTAAELIGGKVAPLTVTFGELTGDWAQFWCSHGSSPDPLELEGSAGTLSSEALRVARSLVPSPLLPMTRGEVVSVESELYLVAYRRDLVSEVGNAADGEPDLAWTASTRLRLELVHLGTAGSLSRLQPFKPAAVAVAVGTSSMSVVRRRAVSRLKSVGLAMLMYVQDYDERIPPLDARTGSLLQPYMKSPTVLEDPVSRTPFEFHSGAALCKLGRIIDPSQTIMACQPMADGEGFRVVCFWDGHVKALSADDWQRASTESRRLERQLATSPPRPPHNSAPPPPRPRD